MAVTTAPTVPLGRRVTGILLPRHFYFKITIPSPVCSRPDRSRPPWGAGARRPQGRAPQRAPKAMMVMSSCCRSAP